MEAIVSLGLADEVLDLAIEAAWRAGEAWLIANQTMVAREAFIPHLTKTLHEALPAMRMAGQVIEVHAIAANAGVAAAKRAVGKR